MYISVCMCVCARFQLKKTKPLRCDSSITDRNCCMRPVMAEAEASGRYINNCEYKQLWVVRLVSMDWVKGNFTSKSLYLMGENYGFL